MLHKDKNMYIELVYFKQAVYIYIYIYTLPDVNHMHGIQYVLCI